ncbi:MAG: acyl carrier protein [Bacteroidales bacterium]|nr:acyl carrier protein [Bacteroidales bacterium]
MDINEIQEKVNAFLVDELEIDESKIEDGARLKEDLGIDSLEVVDVIVLVDDEFGFKMRPEQFKDLKTYGEFCRFIESRVG